MLFSCSCGSTISISTYLFTTLSVTDLNNLCLSYDYSTYSSSPWYDSVMENGEAQRGEEYYTEEEENETDDETMWEGDE